MPSATGATFWKTAAIRRFQRRSDSHAAFVGSFSFLQCSKTWASRAFAIAFRSGTKRISLPHSHLTVPTSRFCCLMPLLLCAISYSPPFHPASSFTAGFLVRQVQSSSRKLLLDLSVLLCTKKPLQKRNLEGLTGFESVPFWA